MKNDAISTLTVNLGLHEAGGQVVSWVRASFLGEIHCVVGDFAEPVTTSAYSPDTSLSPTPNTTFVQ